MSEKKNDTMATVLHYGALGGGAYLGVQIGALAYKGGGLIGAIVQIVCAGGGAYVAGLVA